MTYQRVYTNILGFEYNIRNEIKAIIRNRSNEALAWIRMRFLSHKSSISVRIKSGRLANSGIVVEPYIRAYGVFGGVKFNALDPITGYNYAKSHFRLPGQSPTVIIVPKSKQALAIPIEGVGSYGGSTFARGNLLFVRNSFDPYDFTPVAVLARKVTYPRRIDVEQYIYPYIIPKIKADIAAAMVSYRAR